jgi:hypothetical protein
VCRVISNGTDQVSAIDMVQRDLSVSSYAAGFIVGAATAGLGC